MTSSAMDPSPSNPDASLPSGSPPVIPDHQLLRCIGKGSYGEVYLARNLMGSYRAIKVVHRKTFAHSRPFERELAGIRRFEPISRSHEGLVDVLHVGSNESEEYFYYIMELGDDLHQGRDIDPDHYVPKTAGRFAGLTGRLSTDESLQLGLSLTNALAYLHKQGLVHRDIKPSNIIFVDGVPKLADIGLVAHVDDEKSFVGTEGFLPPEGPGTPQADIYALGKVLYEISTGRDRHDYPELPTILDQIADTERFLELNEVILHACKSDVAKRYQSATDMHGDLVLVDNGGSVKRLRLLERRLHRLKQAVGPAVIGLFLIGVVSFELYREIGRKAEAQRRQAGSKLTTGLVEMDSGQLLSSLPSLVDALKLDRPDREDGYRRRIHAVLDQAPKLVQSWYDTNPILNAQFGPRGKQVILVQKANQIRIYDSVSQEPRSPFFGRSKMLNWATIDPSGQFVVSASQSTMPPNLEVWNATTGELVTALPHTNKVFHGCFSPDGNQILTSCGDRIVRLWNWRTKHVDLELIGHTDFVFHAEFSADGRYIVSGSKDGTVRIWDAVTGQVAGSPLRHSSWVNYVAFSPDGRKIVAGVADNKACVWEFDPYNTTRRIMPDLQHLAGVSSAEFSPDGLMIVTASLDGTVRLWDAFNLQPLPLNSVLKHGSPVAHASFSPDGHRLITSCWDGTTRIWDLAGSSVIPTTYSGAVSPNGSHFLVRSNNSFYLRNSGPVQSTAFMVNANRITAQKLSQDGRLALFLRTSIDATNKTDLETWDTATSQQLFPPIGTTNNLELIAASDDGRMIAVPTNQTVRLFRSPGDLDGQLLPDQEARVAGARFSPNGRWLATFGDKTVYVRDLSQMGKIVHRLNLELFIGFVVFSPDSQQLAAGDINNQPVEASVQIWNLSTGKPAGPILRHSDGVLSAAFSPDGKRLITASENFTTTVWDVASSRVLVGPIHHRQQAISVAFSRDGRLFATTSRDGVAQVWDADSGESVSPKFPHTEAPVFVTFNADGDAITTTSKSGTVWEWAIPPDHHATDDLDAISHLLVGDYDPAFTERKQTSVEGRQLQWTRLRDKYPDDFTVSSAELIAWHRHHARFSENAGLWSAAQFHLHRLAELCPHDAEILARLTKAQENLEGSTNQ